LVKPSGNFWENKGVSRSRYGGVALDEGFRCVRQQSGRSQAVLTFVVTMIILLVLSGLVLLAVARGEGKNFG
jgi:hypothetical protein